MLRWITGLILGTLLLVGVPSVGFAECRLSPEDSAQLKTLQAWPSSSNRDNSLGIFYLDHRCWPESRKEFLAVIASADGPEIVRVGASEFLQFLDALESLDRGDLKLARKQLVQVLGQTFHTTLLERVPFVLADVLSQAPDPESWKVLEEALKEIAQRGSWLARAFLINRLLSENRGMEAMAQVEADLGKDLEEPRRIELQIELLRLLFVQRRLAEAQILLSELDGEVGEKVLDTSLRVNFLLLAVEIWSERMRAGGDPTAARKLGEYSKALNQLDPAVKPRGFVQ